MSILVLGATGVSGIAFLKYVLSLPTPPHLNLLVRTPSKLPQELVSAHSKEITIIEGSLNDEVKIDEALEAVTSVVCWIGAYPSLYYFIWRSKPVPLADSMRLVVAAMKKKNVKRILTLSTPGHSLPGESYNWTQWLNYQVIPPVMIPQGSHEMTAIAQVCADPELDYTIFRVPFLSSGGEELRVYAGMIDPEYKGSTGLSRGSMVKWVYEEIDKREWVGREPAVGN